MTYCILQGGCIRTGQNYTVGHPRLPVQTSRGLELELREDTEVE